MCDNDSDRTVGWVVACIGSEPLMVLSLEHGCYTQLAQGTFFPTRRAAIIYRREFGLRNDAAIVEYELH